MKRTTIIVDEELLYDLQQIAQQQGESTSSVIREALASYVTSRHELEPPENPLLALIGLGSSDEAMDLADGGDEKLLRSGVDPTYGWSVDRDSNR
ncbi:MAG: ribbon-helix-helix protein, CopG family [Anaerolineae bacterium]|nr:ribbon-helix-helix protein, CopG family [Anaerolineae bacterium]